jgi:hypothetical protein
MLSSLKKVFQFCYDNFFFIFGKILKNIFSLPFMEINGSNIKQKTSKKYCCEICQYNTERKSNYENHLTTAKHLKEINGTNFKQKTSNIIECEICSKIFQTSAGLWKHKKKCKTEKTDSQELNSNANCNDLIIMLIKQNSELVKDNSELKSMVMKVLENGTNNTTNNTVNTNSHNKSFNLNFFLNETCKDAMNIMDFVESIKLQLSDLERVGEKGYIEGISNIIIKNLKDLDITQRPVHCTDKKRETIYVKDEDKWEKDDENKKMHKLVRKVQDKNFRMIQKFKEKYPNYYKASSKQSDVYNNIIIESMGGKGDNDFEKEEKIIKKVSKEITIEK